MLKIQEIREIIKLVDHSSVDEFSYEHEGSKIKLKKKSGVAFIEEQPKASVHTVAKPETQAVQQAPQPEPTTRSVEVTETPAVTKTEDNADLHKIVSPMVGTFYQSPSPDAGAYVKVGSKVNTESVVCIVEAMKLFNEIEAEVNGEIVEILVKDGQLVEYGQPLFLVKP
ncbi:acetyl-CoA carboxylase biotin carboxyl carrier protein [Bacillus pakistanensis]|uniref:Biotin carboxyl carrier protein of acetyl-CoA carboxylase n=1 Tax=Rossellomorea pakistanensis TaxID=992288 RepID=A0ABS2N9Q7_9BACI|nr:acetyl-CoA carboxylase biotin carboxyl carrier protein [Bacillus pakistanensis]MBM7584577.1 acetyl-CoA carboxylase biotin carboxyl carrier protein [Bacillus pakistanensis]